MIQAITPKTNTQLERAKQVHIDSIYKNGLRIVGVIYMVLCPFHDDHNPSMALYTQTNTFYCFSCREHGDVIKLYMKVNDCDFLTALRELSK